MRTKSQGFSLVEIAISVGIFAFCLIAVLGLFASGLKTERSSQEEESAASVLASLNLGLENSFRNTNGTYTAVAPLEGWTWNPSNGATTNGRFGEYAYWVRAQLVNTAGESKLVNARLETAWPPETVQWDSDGHATKVRGTAGSTIFFFLK